MKNKLFGCSKLTKFSLREDKTFLSKNNSTFQRLVKKTVFAGIAHREKGKDTTFVYDIYKSYLRVLKTARIKISLCGKYGPFEGELEKRRKIFQLSFRFHEQSNYCSPICGVIEMAI